MNDDERVSMTGLSPGRLAWLLTQKRSVLLERWASRVLADPEVPAANKLSRPALEDDVPALIARLLGRLARHPTADWGERLGREVGASEVGVAHARHRFGLNYTLPEALRELSHLRTALIELCHEYEIALSVDEAKLMHATLDEMMSTSATELEAFSTRAHEDVMTVVAHDLRNPINVVTLQASRMKEGQPIDVAKAGALLERSAKLMQRLVDDLIVLSKLEAGHLSVQKARVDIRLTAQNVVDQLRFAASRASVALTFTAPPREVSALCDADRIEQALGNLLANAIKFTPKGGRASVELEVAPDHAVFRVSDTGPGVKPEHAEDIFRAFWRVPGVQGPGVGLGLAIARGIVEAHGGTITLESVPNVGATFSFTLPLDEAPRGSTSFKIESA